MLSCFQNDTAAKKNPCLEEPLCCAEWTALLREIWSNGEQPHQVFALWMNPRCLMLVLHFGSSKKSWDEPPAFRMKSQPSKAAFVLVLRQEKVGRKPNPWEKTNNKGPLCLTRYRRAFVAEFLLCMADWRRIRITFFIYITAVNRNY